ncbi:MAG: Rossmann-like and DUF2520 domain-containing protein [Prevotella sp.]
MKIALIGAGRLATNLGRALFESGHDIVQVYSRTMQSAAQLALTVDAEPTDSVESVTDEAQVYIISVKDDVINDLATRLCRGRDKAVFIHTAGSVSIDIFKGKARNYGVLYPMQTFSKDKRVDFREIPCFIEADNDSAFEVIKTLSDSVSQYTYTLDSASRRHLHLAAVFACNFVNHCYAISEEILSECGIPFNVMFPLIDETASKVHLMSPKLAQTGPALRYDKTVIHAQSEMLADNPLFRRIYETMSTSINELNRKEQK